VQCQREGRRIDAKECVVDSALLAAVDLADETQRQVQLLARLPTRAGHARLYADERVRDIVGQRQSDE
jgi:hypothetical protein